MNLNSSHFWRKLWLVFVATTATASLPASAEFQTRIVSINGEYSTKHSNQVTVRPGDVVSLVADQLGFDYSGTAFPQNLYVEDFLWTSLDDSGSREVCDAQYDCDGPGFEVTSYGVNFYVPRSMGHEIMISVQNRNNGSIDSLILRNGSAQNTYAAPREAYSDPLDYPEEEFDFDNALVGQGNWVDYKGERFFVPAYHRQDWAPYQHGYWYWTSYGWTWMSYDPWGWVTDHYGYWRYHESFGWIWFPFPERRWHAAVVTWFYTDGGIGWYPYWSNYPRGYQRGYDHGYRDGFWEGHRAAQNNRYVHGWTFVNYSNFHTRNVYVHREVNVHVHVHFNQAHANGNYGGSIRHERYRDAREFIEHRSGKRVEEVQVTVVKRRARSGDEVQWVRPARRLEIPKEYRDASLAAQERVRTGKRIPLGSVVTPEGRITKLRVGATVAPRIQNSDGRITTMKPRTRISSRLPDSRKQRELEMPVPREHRTPRLETRPEERKPPRIETRPEERRTPKIETVPQERRTLPRPETSPGRREEKRPDPRRVDPKPETHLPRVQPGNGNGSKPSERRPQQQQVPRNTTSPRIHTDPQKREVPGQSRTPARRVNPDVGRAQRSVTPQNRLPETRRTVQPGTVIKPSTNSKPPVNTPARGSRLKLDPRNIQRP
ncbi:MAG: DUF6600 domain-containing protein [Bdellovibrionota bacterium]